MRIIYFAILMSIVFVMTSCFPKIVNYDPQPCDKFDDIKKTIEYTFRKQIPGKTPLFVEVTDDYISWSNFAIHNKELNQDMISLNPKNTIYFDNITNLEVISKRGRLSREIKRYEIRITNRSDGINLVLFYTNKEIAIKGANAIYCMYKDALSRNKKY
jgi:hypothetical protein